MSNNFKGISPHIINLLSENRFNDSKPFYEEHKEELKQGATIPMRQIILDLSDLVTSIDEKMYTNPIYCVSRIRRDTRRTKNKMLYRENLWLMLRRNKNEFPNAPFYFFEFTPENYSFGLVYWVDRQYKLDYLRKEIVDNQKKWLSAVNKCKKANMNFECYDEYKKDKMQDIPKNIKPYIQAKNYAFCYYNNDLTKINTPNLIDELKIFIKSSRPMYEFMINSYDKMLIEEEQK